MALENAPVQPNIGDVHPANFDYFDMSSEPAD
jgi:hypothetical protein